MKVQRLHTLGENGEGVQSVGHQPCTCLQTNASLLPTEQDLSVLSRERGQHTHLSHNIM